MDYSLSNILDDNMPTRQKIMICSLSMFCSKGYSETTIRDIASAVGITPGSIYGHFSSKEEILYYMLDDYAEFTKGMFHAVDIVPILKKKPTGEGISECFMLSVSILTGDAYYGNLVHLIHQEQHRNDLFGAFVLVRLQDIKEFTARIFDTLKEMKVIRADADAEYWGVFAYGILHLIPTCAAISAMRNTPSYDISDLGPMLSYMFDAMLNLYKLPDEEADGGI